MEKPNKRPRVVEFREKLPKTIVGKLLRRALVAEDTRRQEDQVHLS